MNFVQKIQFAVRLILAGVLIRLAYEETGIWTTVILVLMTLAIEALAYSTRRNSNANPNPTRW